MKFILGSSEEVRQYLWLAKNAFAVKYKGFRPTDCFMSMDLFYKLRKELFSDRMQNYVNEVDGLVMIFGIKIRSSLELESNEIILIKLGNDTKL